MLNLGYSCLISQLNGRGGDHALHEGHWVRAELGVDGLVLEGWAACQFGSEGARDVCHTGVPWDLDCHVSILSRMLLDMKATGKRCILSSL